VTGPGPNEGGKPVDHPLGSQEWDTAHIATVEAEMVEQWQKVQTVVPVSVADNDGVGQSGRLHQLDEDAGAAVEQHPMRSFAYEVPRGGPTRRRIGPVRTENVEQHYEITLRKAAVAAVKVTTARAAVTPKALPIASQSQPVFTSARTASTM